MGFLDFIEKKQAEAGAQKWRRQERENYFAECRRDKDIHFYPEEFLDFKERYLYVPLPAVSYQPKPAAKQKVSSQTENVPGDREHEVRFSLCPPEEPRKYPYPPVAEGEAFDRLIQLYDAGDFTGMREELRARKAHSFADGVREYMDRKGLSAVEVYTNADVLKQTFSKIMNHEDYRDYP